MRGCAQSFRSDEADQKGQVRSWTPADGTCAARKMNSERGVRRARVAAQEEVYLVSRLPSIIARRAYVYFENEPGRRAAAKLLTREARWGPADPIASSSLA